MTEYTKLPPLPTTSVKYIAFRGKVEAVTLYTDGLFRDEMGTVTGLADEGYSGIAADNRCGYGWFSLAKGNPVNDACTPHDYTSASKTYQMFHTRNEATEYLENLLQQMPTEKNSSLPEIFTGIVRLVARFFWYNKDTNK